MPHCPRSGVYSTEEDTRMSKQVYSNELLSHTREKKRCVLGPLPANFSRTARLHCFLTTSYPWCPALSYVQIGEMLSELVNERKGSESNHISRSFQRLLTKKYSDVSKGLLILVNSSPVLNALKNRWGHQGKGKRKRWKVQEVITLVPRNSGFWRYYECLQVTSYNLLMTAIAQKEGIL